MEKDLERRALIVVDAQNDFIDGSLAVDGAAEAIDALARYVADPANRYALRILTRDFHPAGHCSFTHNGGQWPTHCEGGTYGAMIRSTLMAAIERTPGAILVADKGTDIATEEYSVLANPLSATAITALIKALHIAQVDVCGIAGDYCVANTIADLRRLLPGLQVNVLMRFTPSIDDGTILRKLIDKLDICAR